MSTPKEVLVAYAAACRKARKSGEQPPPRLECDLRWSDLRGCDLSGCDLSGCDLSWCDLRGTDLSGCNLHGSNLSKSKLHRSNLSGSNLSESNLSGSHLRWSDLRGAPLKGADLHGADLHGTGVLRLYTEYEVTLYPGDPEPELAYGCERHSLSVWDATVAALCQKHSPDNPARREAEIRALIALCRTIPQPIRQGSCL